METLADVPKEEECKLNLHLMSFETKEGETKKELMQRLNIELLQGQMRLRTKVVDATWQLHVIVWAFALAVGACPNVVLLKFTMNKDHQVTLRRCKGLARTKLGLDENLTLASQSCGRYSRRPRWQESVPFGT
jgi:hypothetical protein